VRGRADISVSVQPYGRYDRAQYTFKRMNVEVSVTVTFCITLICATFSNFQN